MSDFHTLKSRGIIRNAHGDIFLAFIPKAGFFLLTGWNYGSRRDLS